MTNDNRFGDIDNLGELRGNAIGRIQGTTGFEMEFSGSDQPLEDINEIMEEYENRKEEITQ